MTQLKSLILEGKNFDLRLMAGFYISLLKTGLRLSGSVLRIDGGQALTFLQASQALSHITSPQAVLLLGTDRASPALFHIQFLHAGL